MMGHSTGAPGRLNRPMGGMFGSEEYAKEELQAEIGALFTAISPKAFGGNKNLREVRIGNNVKEIGEWAFFGCENLTSIVLPASVKKVGNYAFRGCTSLTSVTIRNKTPKKMILAKHAFSNKSIKMVRVPKGKRKAYRKLLFSKGLNRKAKVK